VGDLLLVRIYCTYLRNFWTLIAIGQLSPKAQFYSEAFIEAATLEGQALIENRICSARELAKLVGVRPLTIIAWRKLPRYRFYINLEIGRFR
jgi:hypothetical protein